MEAAQFLVFSTITTQGCAAEYGLQLCVLFVCVCSPSCKHIGGRQAVEVCASGRTTATQLALLPQQGGAETTECVQVTFSTILPLLRCKILPLWTGGNSQVADLWHTSLCFGWCLSRLPGHMALQAFCDTSALCTPTLICASVSCHCVVGLDGCSSATQVQAQSSTGCLLLPASMWRSVPVHPRQVVIQQLSSRVGLTRMRHCAQCCWPARQVLAG